MSESISIGQIFKNTKGFEFEILEKVKGAKWKIKFLNSGYETISANKEILNGHIKDHLSPYVCGVGIVGLEIEKPQSHPLYDRWRDMLRRCYDTKYKGYKDYGATGCTVCDEWHYFPNYVRDIEAKPNSEYLKSKNFQWTIDKDTLIKGNKLYSDKTTCIISNTDNVKERNQRHGNPSKINQLKVMQFDTEGNYIKTWDNLVEANKYLHETDNCNTSWMISCCKGSAYTYLGYCWMYEKDFVDFDKAKQDILNKKKNLNKRDKKYRKTIQQFDANGNLLGEWICEDLANELKITPSGVYGALNRNSLCKGYKLKYKEDN
jgi:hypothetical protein